MKHTVSLNFAIVAVVLIMNLAGCTSKKELVFANREWHISDHYGQIIDRDTLWRMTFGNVLIPDPLPVISSADSLAAYPGMERFISEILHTCRLDSAEILFYAPQMQTMYVRPNGTMPPARPSSISSPMDDERPFTTWIYEDDSEDWTRDPSEMYTYTYFDKSRKRILIVDFFDYGETPIAQIVIFQSRSKSTSKMKIPEHIRAAFWYHDLNDFTRDIEFWANQIDAHRKVAFANYKIGQEQAKRAFDGPLVLAQADSALFAGSPRKALDLYGKYLKYENATDKTALYNAACAASLSGETDCGLVYLKSLADQDSTWYLKEPLDKDLQNLTELPEWEEFATMIAERRNRIEKNFNQPLRRRLTRIRRSDQDVRNRFLTAYKSQTPDSALINRLLEEMQHTDAANLAEIENILAEFGWPGRDKVGDECVTIWLVLQHSDIDSQIKALPMLRTAAAAGDISPEAIAMLEDRILVNTGRKQLYGTQYFYTEAHGKKARAIYPIEDVGKVDERRKSVGLPPLNESYNPPEIDTLINSDK